MRALPHNSCSAARWLALASVTTALGCVASPQDEGERQEDEQAPVVILLPEEDAPGEPVDSPQLPVQEPPAPPQPEQVRVRLEQEPNDTIDLHDDQATLFALGEGLRGELLARGAEQDIDYFRVKLEAGQFFSWTLKHSSERALHAILFGPDAHYGRELVVEGDAGERTVFIPESGVYHLGIYDERLWAQETSQDRSAHPYEIMTRARALPSFSLQTPGIWTDALQDYSPDVHRFTWGRDEVVMAEIICERDPIRMGIDPVLYLWDPIEARVVAANDNSRRDSLDPAIIAHVVREREYLLVVDAPQLHAHTPYALSIAEVDDSPDVPTHLSAGMSWRAEIGDPVLSMEHFDTDYFRVVLKPGESMRIEVQADDALLPALSLFKEDGGFYDQVDFAAPHRARAALTFHASEDAEQDIIYYVLLDDVRNLKGRVPGVFAGGPAHTYTLTATAAHATPSPATLPYAQALSFPDTGALHWLSFSVQPEQMLVVDASSEETERSPLLVWAHPAGSWRDAGAHVAMLTQEPGEQRFGVREQFFRGASAGSGPISVTAWSIALDTHMAPITREHRDNHDVTLAQQLSLPARVAAYAHPATLEGHDIFKVWLNAGDRLAAWTDLDPQRAHTTQADTVLHLFDPEGQHILSNDDRLAAKRTTFSALGYQVREPGHYFLLVEPYAHPSHGPSFEGPYMLHVTSAPSL